MCSQLQNERTCPSKLTVGAVHSDFAAANVSRCTQRSQYALEGACLDKSTVYCSLFSLLSPFSLLSCLALFLCYNPWFILLHCLSWFIRVLAIPATQLTHSGPGIKHTGREMWYATPESISTLDMVLLCLQLQHFYTELQTQSVEPVLHQHSMNKRGHCACMHKGLVEC